MLIFLPIFLLAGAAIGLVANKAMLKGRPVALAALGVGGALIGGILGFVVFNMIYDSMHYHVEPYMYVILVVFPIGGAALAAWLVGPRLRTPTPVGGPLQRSVGVTADGTPVYPIVGYTPQGQPVTADRLVAGTAAWNPKTNTLAITALIMGLVFPLAAIPTGHIARSQIRRTGEQGAGLALAGVILGYIGVVASVVGVIIFVQLTKHAY